jgi:4-amino-4-deoxy-L-arabinose transferase-like glycosyltransferase/membrane-associated phospholipid phosphatase
MHWLQALDTRIFYFINHSMSNRFFDWLMPVLSGADGVMKFFIPIIVLAALAAIFFGNTRARLCALLIVAAVAIGNPLVLNTIKHAVHRTRPCIALANANVLVGKTNSGSMPSAHAANWFSAVMIVFIFYRRKKLLLVPTIAMACAVSFSRVYNGVHYPSDVLAGAILGAGYAAAIAIALQVIWNFIGKKWFPFWHAQLPNLLNPPVEKPQVENQKSEIEWLRCGYLLIFLMLIGRWIYLASGTIELSQDEAYQWTWSKHLALSYYSKPPGIAWIQFAGTHLFGDTQFGVRFFSPLFAAILSLMLLRFIAKEIGARVSFWLLVVATATPLLGIGTILMTIDPPLVLCWTWAMLVGWRALQPDGKTRDWIIVGLAMGLAFLCKYSAIYEPICLGIFFALWKPSRIHLRKPAPWLALGIFLICTLPVWIWNAQHGWITIHHVASNAGLGGKIKIRTLDFLLDEFALLNPIFFIGMIWALFACWKFRRKRPLWLYFFCMSAPVLLGHLLWSFHSRILPNWIAPAVIPAFCLMVAYWNEKCLGGWRWVKPIFVAGSALGIFAVAVLYQSNLISKLIAPLPGEMDPSRRARGWSQEAAIAENAREQLQAQGKPAFIICSHYGITGLYSFYIPQARRDVESDKPLVYSADWTTPENQFYFWPEYNYLASRKGQNAIFISEAGLYKLEKDWPWKWLTHQEISRTEPPAEKISPDIAQQFQSVKDLGERDVKIGNRVFHRIHLWACYDLK